MRQRISRVLIISFVTVLWSGLSLQAETEVYAETPEYNPPRARSQMTSTYVPDRPAPETGGDDDTSGTPGGEGNAGDPVSAAEAREDMLQQARRARTLEIAGGVATGAAAVYLFTKCEAGAIPMCMFAMMAAQQSVSLFQTAGQTNQSIQDLLREDDSGGGDGSGGDGSGDDDGDGGGDGSGSEMSGGENPVVTETMAQITPIARKLSEKGYTVDGSGNVRGPGGQSLAAGSLGSASAMKSNGLSDADIDALGELSKNAGKRARDRLRAVAVGIESGGGGRRPVSARRDQTSSEWRAETPARGVASVEGMHRRLGNDRIGVAGDQLFDMIHRSYQNQRQKGAVLE